MNYKHLYYFWMVARIGGVVRASQRLHVTPQTLSGQIKLLEDRLGCALFQRDGRHIKLTEAGRIAASYADDIFTKGIQLEAAVRECGGAKRVSAPATFKPHRETPTPANESPARQATPLWLAIANRA
jgi:LysR family transcriptional regulator, transcriptional activator of nhaA